MPFATS
jgi:hypothetical protein